MNGKRNGLIAALVLLAMVVAACGGSGGEETTTTAAPADTTQAPAPTATEPQPEATTTTSGGSDTTSGMAAELTISAVDSEGFSTSLLEIVAGEEVTLTFENKDAGEEPHNIHIRTDSADYFTPITQGPDTQSITFTIDTPGEYDFFCDTHLEQMKGKLVVK